MREARVHGQDSARTHAAIRDRAALPQGHSSASVSAVQPVGPAAAACVACFIRLWILPGELAARVRLIAARSRCFSHLLHDSTTSACRSGTAGRTAVSSGAPGRKSRAWSRKAVNEYMRPPQRVKTAKARRVLRSVREQICCIRAIWNRYGIYVGCASNVDIQSDSASRLSLPYCLPNTKTGRHPPGMRLMMRTSSVQRSSDTSPFYANEQSAGIWLRRLSHHRPR